MNRPTCAALAALAVFGGCIQLKTESEIKPIHITMDVNLKVDKSIDKAFANEDAPEPRGDFKRVKDLLDRKVVGLNNRALLEVRGAATDEEQLFVVETNAGFMRRYSAIAAETKTTVGEVQRRRLARFSERMPAGCGVWIQGEQGEWKQR